MLSLEDRRLIHDLMLVHKMYQNNVDLNFSDFFTISSSHRSAHHNINVTRYKTECCKYFFSRRVRAPWNAVPSEIINNSHNCFKNYITENISTLKRYETSVVRRLGITYIK